MKALPAVSMVIAIVLPLLIFITLHPSIAETLTEPLGIVDRQEQQLRRLETLIESLSKSVSALESSVSSLSSQQFVESNSAHSPSQDSLVGSVIKEKSAWSERFQVLATARLESEAVCATILHYQDLDGLSKYFAVGDNLGRAYIFTNTGEILFELPSHSDSPVTSMLSYLSFRRNESILLIGHADGSIAAHRLSETTSNGDDWLTLLLISSRPFALGSRDLDSPPVLLLEIHQIGRIRYVLAADGSGRIRVFTENGTLYGTAIVSSRPLAFMPKKLLFLTETGAGSLDLRTMSVKEIMCDGLNGSIAKTYTFDGSERSKAYGFTSSDLIHVVLLGDAGNLKCRVRAIRKAEIDGPISIQTIKGCLLAVGQEKVIVYNVSSQYYGRVGAPRPLFSIPLQEIKNQLQNFDHSAEAPDMEKKPLIATDYAKLVVLGLQGRYIAIYRSNFPVFNAESNAMVWSAPVFFFILFLIGVWQFCVKKKDSLCWAGEEAFNNASGTAPASISGLGSNERAFGDGQRTTDLRELRSSGLRGPTRRYISPQHYPPGSNTAFRSTSADNGFRGSADLKYRGQSSEAPPGFPNRREPLFQNTQLVDEHAD